MPNNNFQSSIIATARDLIAVIWPTDNTLTLLLIVNKHHSSLNLLTELLNKTATAIDINTEPKATVALPPLKKVKKYAIPRVPKL